MNILITGAWREAEEYIPSIESLGHKVYFLKDEKGDIGCGYGWVEGIIGNGIFLSHNIELFPGLKYVQLTSAGFDRVPIDYIKAKNIAIFNARGVYDIPMAEAALTGVLCLYKKMGAFFLNKNSHTWEKQREIFELCGKRVAVVGCGSVGTECARKFGALGAVTVGVDVREINDPAYEATYTLDGIEAAFENADIVIMTLPICEETKGFMNARRFAIMKPGAVLVNISRGATVCTGDLIKALEDKLGGAVLDVFETEPLESDNPLWDMENVIITPHNSFIGEGNPKRLAELIFSNLEKVS